MKSVDQEPPDRIGCAFHILVEVAHSAAELAGGVRHRSLRQLPSVFRSAGLGAQYPHETFQEVGCLLPFVRIRVPVQLTHIPLGTTSAAAMVLDEWS